MLKTGAAGASRLQLLDAIQGPYTEALLDRAGVGVGMRVADLGCGIGLVTRRLAERVGPTGAVTAVDNSAAQIALARESNAGYHNVAFHEAGAGDTGLPHCSFDAVYCRALLSHLPEPQRALAHMATLVKPGGVLIAEDCDVTSVASYPESAAFNRVREILAATGPGATIGHRLHSMFLELALDPEVAIVTPVYLTGEEKRLTELTFREATPHFVAAGLVSAEEASALADEMQVVGGDATVAVVLIRAFQVWARRSFIN